MTVREINVITKKETARSYTTEEQAYVDIVSAQEFAEKPMKDWEKAMADTDSTCPRWFEDFVTENNVVLAPGRVKDNYDAKVALRATKPA